jgi:putative membrane protein
MGFLAHWIVTAVAIVVAEKLVPGIHVSGMFPLALAALVLGLVNAFVKPVLQLLSFPLTVLTLGIFYLVVNAACFGLAAFLVPGFAVASFGPAFWGAAVVSLVSWAVGALARR